MPHTTSLLRIAVLNDYPIVVAGLTHVLGRSGHQIEVVEVDSQVPALDGVDIVLCDSFASVVVAGQGPAGLVQQTDAKVVLFAGDLPASTIRAALDAGVAAYISKRVSTTELLAALEAVHRGDAVASPPVGDVDDDGGVGDWPGRRVHLTSREAEILAYIASGCTNDQIARALFLSINTIKTYVRTTYRKIGVARRSQAIVWALDNGFVSESRHALADQQDRTDPAVPR